MSPRAIDVHGILERAGADAEAPEGSQAWALAQVDTAMAEMLRAVNSAAAAVESASHVLEPLREALDAARQRVQQVQP